MIDAKNTSPSDDIPLVVILGPTASGKTKLAIDLATKIDGEIISADSRQVYRGMDIGTGKDFADYLPFFAQDEKSPSGIERLHLVDIIEAGESYNVAWFQRDFQQAYKAIIARQRTPILCGGTGMYIEAILQNYENTQVPINQLLRDNLEQKTDEQLQALFKEKYKNDNQKSDTSTRKRLIRAIEIGDWMLGREVNQSEFNNIPFSIQHSIIFGISIPVEVRRARITKRLHERLENGMIEEVKNLLEKRIPPEKLIFYGLEYKFITEYLMGQLGYNEMTKRLETAIHQFAKRQMTFFRSMERKELKINWLDGLQSFEILTEQILNFIKSEKNDV